MRRMNKRKYKDTALYHIDSDEICGKYPVKPINDFSCQIDMFKQGANIILSNSTLSNFYEIVDNVFSDIIRRLHRRQIYEKKLRDDL